MSTDNREDERNFLHDLSNPLSTVLFIFDFIMDDEQFIGNIDQHNLKQLKKANAELIKIKRLLEERRKSIKKSE